MSPPAIPEEVLDGIAARPDDTSAWEVLTDFLLEHDLPGATLARCDLELMKGISNPDLLGALAQARHERPRLPFEPSSGFDEVFWRCGFVVWFVINDFLETERIGAVLAAPALRGLHHLRFEDLPMQRAHRRLTRVENALKSVTPHLRRLGVTLQQREAGPAEELDLLAKTLPAKLTRLDLELGPLSADELQRLLPLARRVNELNLDGTRLAPFGIPELEALVEAAPNCTFFLAGTGRSKFEWAHPRVRWELPEAVAWLEQLKTGIVVPLTPLRSHDYFRAPAWPHLQQLISRELIGWWTSRGGQRIPLEDGAVLQFADGDWLFRRQP
ncbi:MAG TPA: hypothetical protein VGE37_14660 [Archangium sp.]